MKKLSFLELEKEMDVLSKNETSIIKGGGPPRDCAFRSLHYIMSHRYGFYSFTEQETEDAYNDDMNGNDNTPKSYENYADVNGLQDINESNAGLGWINDFLSDHYNDGSSNSSATWEDGNSAIPNTTSPGESNQYMLIVNTGRDTHAVVFDHKNANGDYVCYDPQLKDGSESRVIYPSSAVTGSVVFHEQPSTTQPSTTLPPSTRIPSTTI